MRPYPTLTLVPKDSKPSQLLVGEISNVRTPHCTKKGHDWLARQARCIATCSLRCAQLEAPGPYQSPIVKQNFSWIYNADWPQEAGEIAHRSMMAARIRESALDPALALSLAPGTLTPLP